jgi:hypothetical protein
MHGAFPEGAGGVPVFRRRELNQTVGDAIAVDVVLSLEFRSSRRFSYPAASTK